MHTKTFAFQRKRGFIPRGEKVVCRVSLHVAHTFHIETSILIGVSIVIRNIHIFSCIPSAKKFGIACFPDKLAWDAAKVLVCHQLKFMAANMGQFMSL